MSLQQFHNAPFALASFSLIQFGSIVAENLGGLDSDESGSANNNDDSSPKDKATATVKGKTDTAKNTNTNTNTDTGTTNTAGTTDTTQETTQKPETNIATTTTNTDKVTYNQWGFTGSQSVWGEETKTVSLGSSESSSASHSTHSVKGNKTSNANRISDNIVSYDGLSKKTFLIASLIGISACISAL